MEIIMGLNARRLNVPDKIILSDGIITKEVTFESCEPLQYLQICVGLHFYNEEGVV